MKFAASRSSLTIAVFSKRSITFILPNIVNSKSFANMNKGKYQSVIKTLKIMFKLINNEYQLNLNLLFLLYSLNVTSSATENGDASRAVGCMKLYAE